MAQDSIKSRLLLKIKAADAEMKQALMISFILHMGIMALFIWGVPNFSKPKQLQENINVVEILPVADITNVRIAKPKIPKLSPDRKQHSAATPPKPSVAEPVRKKAPKIKVKARPIQARKIEPLPKAMTKPKEPEPKKEEPKEKPTAVEQEEVPEDAFASVLKSVEKLETIKSEPEKDTEENEFNKVEDFLATASKESYQPGIPLSISEIDAVRQQIMRNWTVLGGARDAQEMQVRLAIKLERDGTVTQVEIINDDDYGSDPYFRAMADSAVRAVQKSSPLQHLPEEKYEGTKGWNQMELTFDPSEMLY